MNQTEFNKTQLYNKLLEETKSKSLSHVFLLNEFKRNHWNVNEKQVTEIANYLEEMPTDIMKTANSLGILNISPKLKKKLVKQNQL